MTDYAMMLKQAEEMLAEEPWYVTAMSNLSALIMENMDGLNWAGFYLRRGGGRQYQSSGKRGREEGGK